ncbi:MAG: threonine transporter RhtB [Acidobacteria bacterium]|nr:MAG: threonine transporter RhtB [Acidobacteriota bacterium]
MHHLPPAPQLLAFLVVAGLLTITPGADMALVMRHALAGGTRPAFFASLGICLGTLIWGALSALGVAVLFARSAFAFAVLKYVGGAYLVYLGARALREAIRGHSTARTITATATRARTTAFAQGLATNLTNPKVAVFYVTFLPQFVAPDRNVLTQSVFLAFMHVVMGLIWLPLYARFIDRMAAVLLTDRVRRRIEAVTGAVLMALGIRLALARR